MEKISRIEGKRACTEGQCAWEMPSTLKSVQCLPIKDLDFTSSRGKKMQA